LGKGSEISVVGISAPAGVGRSEEKLSDGAAASQSTGLAGNQSRLRFMLKPSSERGLAFAMQHAAYQVAVASKTVRKGNLGGQKTGRQPISFKL
jgi:hypothetical protein